MVEGELEPAPGSSSSSSSSSPDQQLQQLRAHGDGAEEVVLFFCAAYGLTERRRVLGPLRRATAALQAAEPGRQLSLQADILPKIEVGALAAF